MWTRESRRSPLNVRSSRRVCGLFLGNSVSEAADGGVYKRSRPSAEHMTLNKCHGCLSTHKHCIVPSRPLMEMGCLGDNATCGPSSVHHHRRAVDAGLTSLFCFPLCRCTGTRPLKWKWVNAVQDPRKILTNLVLRVGSGTRHIRNLIISAGLALFFRLDHLPVLFLSVSHSF